MKNILKQTALCLSVLSLTACGGIDLETVAELLQRLSEYDDCAGLSPDGECEPQPELECSAEQDCPEGFACLLPAIACAEDSDCADIIGTCVEEWVSCPAVIEPICGADGFTYGNECEAERVGIEAVHPGPCTDEHFGCETVDCAPGFVCHEFIGVGIDGGDTEVFAECVPVDADSCQDDADCNEGSICIIEAECGVGLEEGEELELHGTCLRLDEPEPDCPMAIEPVCALLEEDMVVGFVNACEAERVGAEVLGEGCEDLL